MAALDTEIVRQLAALLECAIGVALLRVSIRIITSISETYISGLVEATGS